MIRPENALNYAEYVQQLKEKNQNINSAPKKVEVENSDLQPQVKDSNLVIGITDNSKKNAKAKTKQRKQEVTLEANFKTGDDYERRHDNRENNKNYGKKKGNKFQYNPEDFPEL